MYLCDLKQYTISYNSIQSSCELVSKFCIFVIWNSLIMTQSYLTSVVNWFQNFVSLWSETVNGRKCESKSSCELVSKFCIFVIWNSFIMKQIIVKMLWIGFKILYLCDLKQYKFERIMANYGCELVSKFCIFVIWNSVNMQQNSRYQLWIGFKILYLCDLKQ